MIQAKSTERPLSFFETTVEHPIPDLSNQHVQQRLCGFKLSATGTRALAGLVLIGVASFGIGLVTSPDQAWSSLLMSSFLLLSLGLSGLFFIAVSYLAGAGWYIAMRRIPEAMVSLIPAGALGVALVLIFHSSIYPWVAGHEGGELKGFKGYWLDYSFFLCRAVAYVAIWLLFAAFMLRNSRVQDRDGNLSHTKRNTVLSAFFIVAFSLSYWLASTDWIMTLEPHWYSTIFGVYNFSGLFSSGIAGMILIFIWLKRSSPLGSFINEEHLHDLGKLLLGFTTFWAYIWFSQYMLIWYANIPEETSYYITRLNGAWGSLFVANLVLNWIVPFLTLLPRATKRSTSVMAKIAAVVLVGRWLDGYLMIYPAVHRGDPGIGISEIGITIGTLALACLLISRALGKAALLPLRDPYLQESLHYHQ